MNTCQECPQGFFPDFPIFRLCEIHSVKQQTECKFCGKKVPEDVVWAEDRSEWERQEETDWGKDYDFNGDYVFPVCPECAEKHLPHCVCCGRIIDPEGEEDIRFIEGGKHDGELIHHGCLYDDELEPIMTVNVIAGEIPEYWEEEIEGPVFTVGEYHDQTNGDFTASWVSTDAWRGYYSVEDRDKWVCLVSDALLMSQEEHIQKFDAKVKEFAEANNLTLLRVISRTSNVCAQGYELWTLKEQEDKFEEILDEMKEKYYVG